MNQDIKLIITNYLHDSSLEKIAINALQYARTHLLDDEDIRSAIIDLAQTQRHPQFGALYKVQIAALHALADIAQYDYPQITTLLKEFMDDGNAAIAEAASVALSHLTPNDSQLREEILKFIQSESIRVSAENMDALLSCLEYPKVYQTLLNLIEHKNERVRVRLIKAFAPRIPYQDDIKNKIYQRLGDQSDWVKGVTIDAITKHGITLKYDNIFQTHIIDLLEHNKPDDTSVHGSTIYAIRAAAQFAHQNPNALPAILRHANSQNYKVRLNVAQAINQITPPQQPELVEGPLSDPTQDQQTPYIDPKASFPQAFHNMNQQPITNNQQPITNTDQLSTLLNDIQIADLCLNRLTRPLNPMITPYIANNIRQNDKGQPVISYGQSSFGYDFRISNLFRIFTPNGYNTEIDPKDFDQRSLVEFDAYQNPKGNYITIPPNSFALGSSIEWFNIPEDILVIALGKSTYARCGIVVNFTPFEPGWAGHVTIEISNTTPLPARIYADEGIAQAIFLRGQRPATTYADKQGKYQNQTDITLAKV